MGSWIGIAAGVLLGLATFIGTIIVQTRAAATIQGALGADVKNQGKALEQLRGEQDQQWSKINDHGERLKGLEVKVENLEGGKV